MSIPAGDWVVEHKTAAADIGPGSTYWRKLTLDSQCSNYMVGSRELGMDPKGVIYDVTRKIGLQPKKATPVEERKYTQPKTKQCPECKRKKAEPGPHVVVLNQKEVDEFARLALENGEQYTEAEIPQVVTATCVGGVLVTDPGGKLYANLRADDETLDEFRARCIDEVASNLTDYFQRSPVVRLQKEEEDSAYDTWQLAEAIRDAQNENRWPRNGDACEMYQSLCDFFPICAEGASVHDLTRYRKKERKHSELSADVVDVETSEGKKNLPVLSTSSAKAYRACPRKYWYAYELGIEAVIRSHALRFGTLWHLGLETWWKTVDPWAAIAAMRAGAGDQEIDEVDLVKAEVLMLGYHVRWRHERYDVLHVEAEFTARLVNPKSKRRSRTWQRSGKLDAAVRVVA